MCITVQYVPIFVYGQWNVGIHQFPVIRHLKYSSNSSIVHSCYVSTVGSFRTVDLYFYIYFSLFFLFPFFLR